LLSLRSQCNYYLLNFQHVSGWNLLSPFQMIIHLTLLSLNLITRLI
jgi:hypothetical protein